MTAVSLPTDVGGSVLTTGGRPTAIECLPTTAGGVPAGIVRLPAGIGCLVLTTESLPVAAVSLPAAIVCATVTQVTAPVKVKNGQKSLKNLEIEAETSKCLSELNEVLAA
jgi:hypothetical protein